MSRKRRDGYVEIGPLCLPSETQISLEQANALKQAVVWDFFEGALKVRTPHVSERTDKTIATKAFHEYDPDRMDERPSVFAGVVLRHSPYDSWRLIIMQTRLRRARHNNAQQRIETRLNFEVLGGELLEAIRKTRIVRGVGELTAEAIEQQMEEDVEQGHIVTQRRAYERQVTDQDCQQAAEFLHSVAIGDPLPWRTPNPAA